MNIHTLSTVRTRTPVSALAKLAAALLAAIPVVFLTMFPTMGIDPVLSVVVALFFITALLSAFGLRWGPAVGGVFTALILFGMFAPAMGQLIAEMTVPGMPMRVQVTMLLPLMLCAIPVGIGATVQNYRRPVNDRTMPRWVPMSMIAVAGIVAGALLLGSVVSAAGGSTLDPNIVANLPDVTTSDMAFAQTELHARVGELVAYRLVNEDSMPHMFDIDEFNVHIPMPVGEEGVALFRPTAPGTYTFYCAPHYDKTTGAGMKGTLIVTE